MSARRRYRVPVMTIVPARTVHREALAALGPGFTADGFNRLAGSTTAAWMRPVGEEFIVCWLQPSRHPDSFGWYGTKFTIEFRRGTRPMIAVSGPSSRFCNLLDDDGREQVRAVQNAIIRRMPPPPPHALGQLTADVREWYLSQGRQVTTAYTSRDDVWFRHRNTHDLADWLRLLPALLPTVLDELRRKLG